MKVSEYLHDKLEKQFNEKFTLPDLESKQKILSDLKDLHKPLSKNDFEEHEKSYEQKKEKLQRNL